MAYRLGNAEIGFYDDCKTSVLKKPGTGFNTPVKQVKPNFVLERKKKKFDFNYPFLSLVFVVVHIYFLLLYDIFPSFNFHVFTKHLQLHISNKISKSSRQQLSSSSDTEPVLDQSLFKHMSTVSWSVSGYVGLILTY